jgi:acyl transferase domain-containing protein
VEGNFTKPTRAELPPDVCFVFSGQGAQYSAMGKSLFKYQVFRRAMEEASDYFQSLGSGWSLLGKNDLVIRASEVRANTS